MAEQRGFFDFDERVERVMGKRPLLQLNEWINWEKFRPILKDICTPPKSPGGRPRYDVLMMFKVLILQRLYNLSDAQTETQLLDTISFMKFIGVDMQDVIPDEKTIWRYKEELRESEILESLWEVYEQELIRLKVKTGTGKIIDANIVELENPSQASKERARENSTRTQSASRTSDTADTQTVKEAPAPETQNELTVHQQRQIDTGAGWTKKRGKWKHGYKNNIIIDGETKLIEKTVVTSANIHDSEAVEQLVEKKPGTTITADKAYVGDRCTDAIENAGASCEILH